MLKFFINTQTQAYLRGLADEFGDSTNAIRVELNRLTKAGLLESYPDGRTKLYQANVKHPLFPDLQSIVRKLTGIDQLIDMVLSKLGKLELAFMTGDYAKGIDSGIIDIVIVGRIDRQYLIELEKKAEDLIKRKIRSLVLTKEEFEKLKHTLKIETSVIIWNESGKQ